MTINPSSLFGAPSGLLGTLFPGADGGRSVGPSQALAAFRDARRDLNARGVDVVLSRDETLREASFRRDMAQFERAVLRATDVQSLARDPDVQKVLTRIAGFTGAQAQDRAFVQRVLTSDLSDPNSFARSVGRDNPAALRLAQMFDLARTGLAEIQRFDQLAQVRVDYADAIRTGEPANRAPELPDGLARDPAFQRNMQLFERAVARATDVQVLANDPDVQRVLVAVAGVDPALARDTSLIGRVLLSDLSDPASEARTAGPQNPALLRLASLFDLETTGLQEIGRPDRLATLRKDYADSIVNARNPRFQAEFDRFERAIMSASDLNSLAANPDFQNVFIRISGLSAADARDRSLVQRILLSDISDPTSTARISGLTKPAIIAMASLADMQSGGLAGLRDPKRLAALRKDFAESLKNENYAVFIQSFEAFKLAGRVAQDIQSFAADPSVQNVLVAASGLERSLAANTALVERLLLSDPTSEASEARRLAQTSPGALKLAGILDLARKGLTEARDPQRLAAFRETYADALFGKDKVLEGVPRGDRLPPRIERDPTFNRDMQRFERAIRDAPDARAIARDPTVQRILATVVGLTGQIAESRGLMERVLLSDTSDPNSVAQRLGRSNPQLLRLAQVLDLGGSGVTRAKSDENIAAIRAAYAENLNRRNLDQTTPGLAAALSFVERAQSARTAIDVLADPALREVVTRSLGLPAQLALQSVEAQARAIEARLDVSRLRDPRFVEQFAQRYLTVVNGSGGNSGITA